MLLYKYIYIYMHATPLKTAPGSSKKTANQVEL